MVETLLDKIAAWATAGGPDADVVLATQCRVSRNLSDFAYPHRCSREDKAAVEERVLAAIETHGYAGRYLPFEKLGPSERLFLAEKWLTGKPGPWTEEPGGVFLAEDLSSAITVNDENHVTIRAILPGLQPQELWATASMLDDGLGENLDYAFSNRLGFLTPSLRTVGTGVDVSATLHLPSLEASGARPEQERYAESNRHALEPVFPNGSQALGDLFMLSNTSTLGRSEDETMFHLKHVATELINRERGERAVRLDEARLQVEDRIGRALGLARNARLLASDEGLRILSSLRLGIENGLQDQFSYADIAEALVASQEAHLSLKCGHPYDDLMLNADRATLFRNRFA